MDRRPATEDDLAAVTETIRLAFDDDPIWSVALRRSDGSTPDLRPYWRLFVDGAARHGTVFTTQDTSAVSVWLPPGRDELEADGLGELDRLLDGMLDDASRAALTTLYERFAASRAPLGPHAYLSLLATHPDHRGRGFGQQLLAMDLAAWDAQDVPAYLESTNPANDHRYKRAGFHRIGGFRAVLDDAPVTAMWRDVPAGEARPEPVREARQASASSERASVAASQDS